MVKFIGNYSRYLANQMNVPEIIKKLLFSYPDTLKNLLSHGYRNHWKLARLFDFIIRKNKIPMKTMLLFLKTSFLNITK